LQKNQYNYILFLITIAVTMFQLGPLQTGRMPISKATKGAQVSEKFVSEANDGLPAHPLFCAQHPQYRQHWCLFCCCSTMNDKDDFKWRVAKDDGKSNGFRT